jgi:hypothetical protein
MNLNENISRLKELMGLITEVRKGWYELLKQKLPHFPEYVLKDFIYRKVDEYKDYESFNNWINEWLVNIEWEYQKDFPISMDIFSDKSQKELRERISGLVRSDVDRDEERHQAQAFSIYPDGFIQPNVYIGLNAKWLD